MTPVDGSAAMGRRHSELCNASILLGCLKAAVAWLEVHTERINALNVYPVPDGDTGTNMLLTFRAALEAAEHEPSTRVADLTRSAAHGALLGARGNSGVILSQLMRGFAHGLEGCNETFDAVDLASALAQGAQVAYHSVSHPVEGTLLTVAREVGDAAEAALKPNSRPVDLLKRCVHAAERAVERTPDQLDVLRHAGVVDAGGEGYRVLLEGALMHLTGQRVEMPSATQPGQVLARARDAEEAPLGFCTELVLGRARADVHTVRQTMERLGSSVIVVGDDDMVRIHVHALRPGQVLEFAVDHGVVQQVKIENMELQHRSFVDAHTLGPDLRKIGVVAIASGDGFRTLFKSLGAAAVVEGGQGRNPSVQEILAAVNGAAFEELVILPNNRNVILAANHVRGLTARRVEVLGTESDVQGVAAMLAFNYLENLDANLAGMRQAASRVRTVELTTAVRDAEVDDLSITRGDHVALLDSRVVASGPELCDVVSAALEHANAAGSELVTVYHGKDVTAEDAQRLFAYLKERHKGPEWGLIRGGQAHYQYVIAIE
jgi:DAK2 domain fusion protein YloV